jgi:hypothetical protein
VENIRVEIEKDELVIRISAEAMRKALQEADVAHMNTIEIPLEGGLVA